MTGHPVHRGDNKVKQQTRRHFWQAFWLTGSLAWVAWVIAGGRNSVHEGCPYAMVCFGLNKGDFLNVGRSITAWAIIAGFGILISTLFWGRRFCGWICPLGTSQEALFSTRSKKYRTRNRLPFFYDKRLAFIKYLVLTFSVIMVVVGLNWIFMRACPMFALSNLPSLLIPGVFVLVAILIGSLKIDRVWCRFLCPYAALMNVFQWAGDVAGVKRSKVKRNLERCTDCGVCMLYCPMNINIQEDEYVHNPDCIHCGLCADKCPKPGTYSEETE